MSDQKQIESLTKSLSQIVHQLTNSISKKDNVPLVEKESVYKKTSDMTYLSFLVKVLSSRPPVQVGLKKQSYCLQQDLQLLLELSSHTSINTKCFEEISSRKKPNRTTQSLKSRYSDYLSKVGQPQMKKIVNWIERQGVQGFMHFDGGQFKINLKDPKAQKTTQNKEVKRNRPVSLQSTEKKYQKKKQGPKKTVPTNCKELNDILKMYSKMVNIPIKTLLEKLDQVSGDFVQLDNYIQTKDNKLLWNSEEDQILRKGGIEVELLKRYRGAGVEARKKYLGIY